MGASGRVRLVNKTSQRWTKVYEHSYQMNSWEFPESIEAGGEGSCVVEWSQRIFVYQCDDAGEARYRHDRDGYEFEVQARNKEEFMILVENISVPGPQWGYRDQTMKVGWEDDGTVSFELPGRG